MGIFRIGMLLQSSYCVRMMSRGDAMFRADVSGVSGMMVVRVMSGCLEGEASGWVVWILSGCLDAAVSGWVAGMVSG